MTMLVATAESGTNGATVDTATYGTDNPWNTVLVGTGATTFTTEQSFKGTKSYKTTFTSSVTAQYMEWIPAAASRTAAARIYFRLASAVTGSFQLFTFHKSDGSAKQIGIDIQASGVIRIQDAVSAIVGTSAGSIAANQWYRMEIKMDNSGGTAAGTADIQFYLGDSTTPEANLGFTLTGRNFGANNIGAMRVGRFGTNSCTATMYFDDIAYQDTTSTFIGPSGSTTVRPDSDTSNAGAWTTTGSANGFEVLADESDATFIESPNNPQTPTKRRFHLTTLAPGPVVVTTRAAATAASPATTIGVSLYQNTTLIASWSHSLTTTITDYSYTLSTGENASITDRSLLYVEFDADSA